MRLLITNDDGIHSPGLLALARCARRLGDVRIFAPEVEQSSMGHAITHSRPLSVKPTTIADFEAWRVNGTPADCVALGLNACSDVEVVLSGINHGPNLGSAAWHSGTLAAARQAALLGCRGLAFSMATGGVDTDFPMLEPYIMRVLELLLADHELKLVNVNFPARPSGLSWTRLSVRQYDGRVVAGEDPMGRRHFWLTVFPVEDVDEGTDRFAIKNDRVSLTPLRLDLTDADALEQARAQHPLG